MVGVAGTSTSLGIDAILQYAGSGVQIFSGMIFYIFIVRLFSTSEVGAVALFIAIIGLFNVIFSFGLGTAAQHFTSYAIGNGEGYSVTKIFHKIIVYGLFASLLGFLILFLMAPYISIFFLHEQKYTELVRLLSLVLIGYILFSILNGSILGLQNFRLSAFINIVIWITYYFGAIGLVYIFHSLSFLIFGWIVGIYFGVVVEIVFISGRLSGNYKPGNSVSNKVMLKYSFPVLLSGLMGFGASYADRFIVAGLLNLSLLGIYNFALLAASAIAFIAVPFNNILLPKLSETYGKGKVEDISNQVRISSTLLSAIVIPASLGLAAMSPSILKLIGGNPYVAGSMPLMIIMFLTSLFATQSILTQAIASVRKTELFIWSSSIAFFVNVFLSYLLIPFYGLVGAAVGYSSVNVVSFFVLLIFAVREKIVSFDLKALSKIWFASIVLFFTIYIALKFTYYSTIFIPAYIILGSIEYIFISRIIHLFQKENLDLILSIFPPNYKIMRKLITFLINVSD